MSFNFNDWYNQVGQSQDPNMNYGGPANNYDYFGLNQQNQGQGQQGPGSFMGGNSTGFPQPQPDIYGSNINSGGGFGGGGPTGPGGFNTPTGGTYTDEFGNQQPNTPISYMGGTTGPYGAASTFNGQQVDYTNGSGSGSGGNANGANSNGMIVDPMTGKMVSANQGPSAAQGPDLFNGSGSGSGNTNASANSAAQSQLAPNLPGNSGGPNYSNLYGGGINGAQQGFNELNNQQFTDTSDAFKRAFGSTQGIGQGNNFNWNVYPQFSADSLDPAAQQQIVAIAQANPQYDFEPTMVNGKWVLASRARDISQQKSLLAPELPPTNPGGGGGAARTSSGYTKYPATGKGSTSGGSGSSGADTVLTQQQALANIGKGAGVVKGLSNSVAAAMQKQGLGADQLIQKQKAIGGVLGGLVGNIFSNPTVQNVATPISPNVPPTPLLPAAGSIRANGYYWDGYQWVPDAPATPPGGNPTFYGDNNAG